MNNLVAFESTERILFPCAMETENDVFVRRSKSGVFPEGVFNTSVSICSYRRPDGEQREVSMYPGTGHARMPGEEDTSDFAQPGQTTCTKLTPRLHPQHSDTIIILLALARSSENFLELRRSYHHCSRPCHH
ncbi:hypothetical protein RRG08_046061 [Elysia crispata]|uniref:Uncharacterized protein n=1 Tax=Elysia crispata TaxID=231223 RepID=A0AAE1DQP0_9GAST|nr:hypothetical protein RRG08_046061 [Elysia crispata]